MKIRLAEKHDLPYVLEMLRHFRDNSPVPKIKECNNEEYINSLYHSIIVGGGVAYVADVDKPVGIIMGYIAPSIWDPSIQILNELVYWVEPEHRHTTIAYRLLVNYNNKANELLNDNRIQMYTMQKMINSPDLDYSKFGYRKIEEIWVAGA